MDESTLVAVCATAVAVASLAVSVYESPSSRCHNRLSVRPLLQFQHNWVAGQRAGLRLINSGLGLAVIMKTVLTADGNALGEYNKRDVENIHSMLRTECC